MNKFLKYVSIFGLISIVFALGTLFFRSDFWQSFWNAYKDVPVEKWPVLYLLIIGTVLILLIHVFMAVFNRIRWERDHD